MNNASLWDKEAIRKTLHGNVCKIVFEKVDGTERTMVCTLREDYLPKEEVGEKKKRATPEFAQPVFDVEINEWRSFKWRGLKSISVMEAYA